MSIIKCENLSLGYDGHALLSDINFEVNAGDYLCVTGENGSGKTTLMKTLLGLQAPLKGKITFSEGLKQTEIGYLPQQSAVQRDFPATVREIVLSGCQAHAGLRPYYTRAEKAHAESQMARMQLGELAKRCYRELSGGQQQRVLLARALCASRRLLLLDEPVSGLDPVVTASMYALIRELNRTDGMTIIMITHDLSSALRDASHILHLGGELFFGPKREFLNSPAFKGFANLKGGDPA